MYHLIKKEVDMARVKAERRKFLRIPKESKVRYHELKYPMAKRDIKNTKSKNVGGGGILFSSGKYIDTGTILKIDITAQGWEKYRPGFFKGGETSVSKPITVIGEVIRSKEAVKNKEYDTAVRFINIHEDDLRGLIGYIENYKK